MGIMRDEISLLVMPYDSAMSQRRICERDRYDIQSQFHDVWRGGEKKQDMSVKGKIAQ